MRAYVACGRQRSLVYFGVVLCSSKYIPFGWVLANVSSSLSVVLHVCQYADLPSELNYVMIMDLVTNFFFCILFIIAIRKHIHLIKTEIEPALFPTHRSHRMKSYYRIVKKTIHFFVISAVSMFVVILMTLLTNIHTNSTILPYYFGMAIATRFLTNAVMSFQRNDRPDSSSQTRTAVAGSNFDAAGEFSSEMPSIIISTSSIRGDSPPPSPNSEKYSLNEVIIDPKSTEQ
ncbi:hypothetical protein K7432_008762 [Basidiobolus ranarum]|uniref:Uncharacterized protein n=1 Tax=Basidiobolus ranarum TaxID=34480 RepID=A0ABR2VYZ7_9FUNG